MISIIKDGNIRIDRSDISTFDISDLADQSLREGQVVALLYYSGYLTIAEGDNDSVTLCFPNTEISTSFTKDLVSRYTNGKVGIGG